MTQHLIAGLLGVQMLCGRGDSDCFAPDKNLDIAHRPTLRSARSRLGRLVALNGVRSFCGFAAAAWDFAEGDFPIWRDFSGHS
jgi:hypothetical protein